MKLPGFHVSVPQLLSGILALGSFSLVVITWQAERVVSGLDALRETQAAHTTKLELTTDKVDRVMPRIDNLEIKFTDLDHRVIRLEPR
jgi:hypothetical protein